MMKPTRVAKILILIAVLIVSILHFVTDFNVIVIGIQQLLLSAMVFISAYEHLQQKKKRDATFWFTILIGTFVLIVAFVVVQPFF